jgi:hypothetical protein
MADRTSSPEAFEVAAMFAQMPPHSRRVMLWLGWLYLEQQVQPSDRVDAKSR